MLRSFWLIMLLFSAGCATVPRTPAVIDGQSLEGLCSKYALDCAWDGVAQTVTLHYHGQRVQAMVGSNIVLAGDAKVVLSRPLERRRGAVIVPADFERLILVQPLPGVVPVVSGWKLGKVVIDAGHGAKDPGAVGFHRLKEKDIVLDVAHRIAKGLRDEGVDVIETRDRDVFLSLPERTLAASRPGIDLFISVHANASKSKRARGFEVYASGALSLQDKADDQRRENVRNLCGLLNMRKDPGDLRDIVADMLYTTKLNETPKLAAMVSRSLAEALGQNLRGSSKTARFYVLRNTLIPSVLIEIGFITNPKEAIQLKEPAYRQKIADAVVQSVMRYTYGTGM
jgi:N-acetylmuramoyl-L-alanine amidase